MNKKLDDNLLDFETHFKKRNRIRKNVKEAKRSKKEKDDAVRIGYLTRRINERKISIEMVEKCIQVGKRIEKNGAYHYIMENFHVVLDRSESTVITAYNKANQKIAA